MAKLNIITLGSSKSYTDLAALGLTNVVVNDQDKTISFTLVADGSTRTLHFAQPSDGVSVTGISDKGNGVFTLLLSDGSESDPIQCVKGEDGFSPTATVEKVGKVATITITDKNGTTTATIKDGEGSEGGEANVIDSISVNGVNVVPDENKNVDITVPSIDGLAKTEDIPTKVSELTNDSGYLTEHQDISGKVDKVEGKSLISDTEIARLASVDNYDDTQVKTQIQAVANGLMDSVGYSADYKTIDIIAKNGVKKSVDVAPIISHASITELSDVDTTNKATGKALVYNATTSKHEYADVSGTDEKVKMDASTDAKYLGELLDNITIANENGELKVKKLDGQEVTITEINYLKGLTMNVMDLVNMFSNGGVKIINTPVATYAELLTIDKSSFIEGISYLVYVLADENHDNAKTTYLVDKDSETPTYFGFADSQRDFTTNPIDLATEITGKLGISNMDSDAIKALFTVDDTYKTETTTNNAFSTHGAKALYDELLLAIGGKANDSDLTTHKDDANIHVSTTEKDNWNGKADASDLTTHTDDTDIHITSDERTKWNNTADKVNGEDLVKKADIKTTTLDENATNDEIYSGKAIYDAIQNNVIGKETVLYDKTITATGTYTLADNVNNYDFILISTFVSNVYQTHIIDRNTWTSITSSNAIQINHGNGDASFYVNFNLSDSNLNIGGINAIIIKSIVGYKFGEVTVQNTITNPSPGESYSTDEQLTGGTWIDGKPIYRKTFYSSSGWAAGSVIGNISDLKLVISLKTVCIDTNGSYWSSPFSNTDQCNMCVRKATGEVLVANKDTFINQEQIVVVEYIKTTD